MLGDGSMVESVLMHYPARGFAPGGRAIHRAARDMQRTDR